MNRKASFLKELLTLGLLLVAASLGAQEEEKKPKDPKEPPIEGGGVQAMSSPGGVTWVSTGLRRDKNRETLSASTAGERAAAAAWYRFIATTTGGRYAEQARLYNIARAEYLERLRQTIPSTLAEFIKLGGL